jgi:hypothetical protein
MHWYRLSGFRCESTVHLTDAYNFVVGGLESDGFPSFESFINRGIAANRLVLEQVDTISFTVDELLYTNLTLNMFCQAGFDQQGYELFANTIGHARSHGGQQGQGRPADIKAHRSYLGGLLIDNFGNANRFNATKSSKNRHNMMLVRYEDFFSCKLLHKVEPIDDGVWRRFTHN